MSIQKLATWIPVSAEALEDAPFVRLVFEYAVFGRGKPLTAIERITGWRSFTSTDGLTSEFRVGWRLQMWKAIHFVRCAATGHELGEWEPEDDGRARECSCRSRREYESESEW